MCQSIDLEDLVKQAVSKEGQAVLASSGSYQAYANVLFRSRISDTVVVVGHRFNLILIALGGNFDGSSSANRAGFVVIMQVVLI